MSPRTTAENSKDIDELKTRQADQDVRNIKIDLILEAVQKQQDSFELVIKQFAEVVTDVRTAITRLQDKQDFTWKVIGIVGSLILVTIGAIIGQFVHFHP